MSTTFKQKLQKLGTLFHNSPIWQDKGDLTIAPAFALGGVQYYEVPGFFNYPQERAMAARDVLMEVDARVTREYLRDHLEAKKKLYATNPLNLLEMMKMDTELEQRINWIASPDAIYKLAAIVYFDKNESPLKVNWKYINEVKIPLWKKYGVASFFLQKPIRKFIPYSELLESGAWKSEEDLVTYIKTAIEMEKIQKENLSLLKSKK